jgi:DNA-binding protein HU-beta
MNNKELISELGIQLGVSQKNAGGLLQSFVEILSDNIVDGKQVNFLNTGVLEQRKKEQRISINPATQKSFLIPPKMSINFKPNGAFKNHIKTLTYYER